MITLYLHMSSRLDPPRVTRFDAENNNAIAIEVRGSDVVIFGLPTEITDLLIRHYGPAPTPRSEVAADDGREVAVAVAR